MIDIEKARALVETLKDYAEHPSSFTDISPTEADATADLIAALLDEVERLNSPVILSEWQKLVAERDALTRRLDEVREIYAGMEGFVPQTAPEGYCLRIIKQMAHAAMKGASDES